MIILTDFHSFTVNEQKLQNWSIFKFSARIRVCDLGQILTLTKTCLFCSIQQKYTCKSSFHSNLILFTDFHSFTVNQDKLQNWSIFKFSIRIQYAIWVKFWQWLKLLYSVPFSKNTLVNQVYIRIWSFSLTFTVLQWMKTNFKISQFSRFLLRSEYTIQVKISKWLKLLYSVPFIKKALENRV